MRSGTARSREGGAHTAPAYFEWKAAGGEISIHLSFRIIDQLETGVMKGFWSVPKRGAEVGGVLFGRARTSESGTVVYIDDFEAVECEHRRGPSYALSEADKRRLERTLRKGSVEHQVVGFYRSHTRLGLYLDQDDYALIQTYFPGSAQVFLLIRPHATEAAAAGFFFWEEGTIRRQATYLEFPFSRAALLKAHQPEQPAFEAAEEPPAPPATPAPPARVAAPRATPASRPASRPFPPLPPPRPPASSPARLPAARQTLETAWQWLRGSLRRVRWEPMAAGAIVLLCLGVIEYQLLKGSGRPAPAAPVATPPGLRVERSGPYLQVNWNRTAPAVLRAERGVLEITDGAHRKELRLDAGQVRTGSVAYAPLSGDVSFRLDLTGGGDTVSESLRVVENLDRPHLQSAAAAMRPRVPVAVVAPPRPAAVTPVKPAPPPPIVQRAELPKTAAKRAPKPVRRRAYFDDGL